MLTTNDDDEVSNVKTPEKEKGPVWISSLYSVHRNWLNKEGKNSFKIINEIGKPKTPQILDIQ